MAGISVEEAREAALPAGTVLLGGRSGLHRSVTGTATLRARTPAFPGLHGGELALVTLSLLRQMEPRPRLDRLVSQLADAGVSAIVFLDTVDTDRPLLEQAGLAADQHALPVLSAPPPHTAEMVDVALHRLLAGRREALLRRSQELQREFTALAFAGRGLPAIVERLATLTGLPASWEDRSLELRGWATPPLSGTTTLSGGPAGEPLSSAPPAADLPTLLRGARLPLLRWAKTIRPEASPDVAALPLRADSPAAGSSGGAVSNGAIGRETSVGLWGTRLVVAFVAGGQVAGYLSLLVQSGHADQEARLALAGAGLAASIEALRARAVTEAQGNATASLVRDWLAGRFDHPGELASRASQLGHTPSPPYGVLVVETDQALAPDGLHRLAQTMSRAAGGLAAVTGIGSARDRAGGAGAPPATAPTGPDTAAGGPKALSAALDERRTVLLVPAVTLHAVESAAGAVHSLLEPLTQEGEHAPSIFVGIGRPAQRLEDVPRSYREAVQALAIARRIGGRHRVAYFGTLGVYRLLTAVSPTEELSSFYHDTLGVLVAHDLKSGGELLRTLDAYIACGGSPLDTAHRLHAHRNTVLYRLDKIAELLGVDVRQPEQRLLFHLAMRAGEVLGELQPGTLSQGAPQPPEGRGRAQGGDGETREPHPSPVVPALSAAAAQARLASGAESAGAHGKGEVRPEAAGRALRSLTLARREAERPPRGAPRPPLRRAAG